MSTYPKKLYKRISPHFLYAEFDCPCTACSNTLIDDALPGKLQALRDALGGSKIVRITSGYRCDAYQEELRLKGYETALGVSQHTLGRAADLRAEGMTGEELEVVARSVGFRAVGVGKRWIHVDLRDDKDRRWTYSY